MYTYVQLRVVFRKFDDDGSGTVSHEEFRTGLVHMGIAMSDPEFKSLIDIVDHDGGGDIDYREFANNFKSQVRAARQAQRNHSCLMTAPLRVVVQATPCPFLVL